MFNIILKNIHVICETDEITINYVLASKERDGSFSVLLSTLLWGVRTTSYIAKATINNEKSSPVQIIISLIKSRSTKIQLLFSRYFTIFRRG